ncbi:MAG: hypothetical protein AB7D08_05730 [Bacteroidales bacterium]
MIRFRPFFVLVPLLGLLAGCKYLDIDAFSGSTLIWESGSNNYFNRDEPHALDYNHKILVTGEVEQETYVNIRNLPWHSVTVKEAVPVEDSIAFSGAFRYDGYALSDILSSVKVDKWEKEKFYPPVDLYVEVWNEKGEFSVFSWGEIFYSADVYKVIIARSVSRVIPGKTKLMWDLPKESRLVSGFDHYSVRNISNPVKIVIKSLRGDFVVDREPDYFRSDSLFVCKGADTLEVVDKSFLSEKNVVEQRTMFYGQSMGNKGEKIYKGVSLGELLSGMFVPTLDGLATSIVCVEATDGYRASFSLSELINRNDNREPLLMYGGDEAGRMGFSIFCNSDMFADRAIKSISKITIN